MLLDTGSNGGLVLPDTLRDELATAPGFTGQAVANTLGGTRDIDWCVCGESWGSAATSPTTSSSASPRAAAPSGRRQFADFEVSVDRGPAGCG